MPQIETPTVRRAVSEISSHFTLKGTVTVTLCAMTAFSGLAAFAYSNAGVLAGVFVGVL
jgi:hypothetical protein